MQYCCEPLEAAMKTKYWIQNTLYRGLHKDSYIKPSAIENCHLQTGNMDNKPYLEFYSVSRSLFEAVRGDQRDRIYHTIARSIVALLD